MEPESCPPSTDDGLSIIVPTYERPQRLTQCLEALAAMDVGDLAVEVVVVDDGSQEPPLAAIATVQDRLDVVLCSQPNAGPASARNTGAERARYRWLAFTDDDCTPDANWARSMVASLRANPNALIGGSTVNAVHANLFSDASQHLIDGLYRWHQSHPSLAFWTSNNMACCRRTFLEIGGFDESFPLPAAEDREFGTRWQRSGRPLRHSEAALVGHHHDLDLRRFWRQHHNYGRGAHRYRELLATEGDTVSVLPPSFYLTLLAEPFRHASVVRAVPMAGLIGLSQVATVAGFFAERSR